MRSKRPFSDVKLSLKIKKFKPLLLDLPIPRHIEIKEGEAVYHFADANQANDFISQLQGQPVFQKQQGIEKISANHLSCHQNALYKQCYCVCLTPNQMDAWLGSRSYRQLAMISALHKNGLIPHVINELSTMNSILMNQAMLITNDEENIFLALMRDAWGYEYQGDSLLRNLSIPVFCQAIDCVSSRDVNGLSRFLGSSQYNFISSQFVIALLKQLPNVLCDKLVLQSSTSFPYMSNRAFYQAYITNPAIFTALLDKLNEDTCNQAALMIDNDGSSALEVIATSQPPEVYRLFEQRLTLQTRMALVFASHRIAEFNEDGYSVAALSRCPIDSVAVKLVSTALQHPRLLRKLVTQQPQLQAIEFFDGGSSWDTWSDIANSVVGRAPIVYPRFLRLDLTSHLQRTAHWRESRPRPYLQRLTEQGWKFVRLQGRTILLEDGQGHWRAVKIQKRGEDKQALCREYDTTCYLSKNAKRLGLQSHFSTPVMITCISDVQSWLKSRLPPGEYEQFEQTVSSDSVKNAYVYDADPRYFTYLHDFHLPDDVFREANRRAVHDLFTLLKHGMIFTQLGDIFHNKEHVDERGDRGRYMVLVHLLRDFSWRGSGRLTDWKGAVEYPNIRAAGLADLGDHVSINDYIYNGNMVDQYYAETRRLYGDRGGNRLLANVMAEYQFILFLIAGRRGCALTEMAVAAQQSSLEIDVIWRHLAQQVMDNCVQAVALLTNQKEEHIAEALNAVVDVERMAKQMRYWMTRDYIEDLKHNRVKEGIYEPDTLISVDIMGFREGTFNSQEGCSIDGVHQDLGPVNGQEPNKEANKLFYWMVTHIFTAYDVFYMTVRDLHKVTTEKDVVASERLRHSLFSHLPSRQYHRLQQALCEERLKQKSFPVEMKEQVSAEATLHKKAYAAATIQTFWRNHRRVSQEDKIENVNKQQFSLCVKV
ncbi:MAG: hypothetical protein A3E83_09250 [Gammaproteobacteria bacterium RIFCSPHIGHO2_12_FULL_41_20]|nr:MAG: hypothetical protein A3E83_09250 [Gammaproteobacteria bacterium RIFCSPHIGHO2_12_FULL_41_20]